MTKYGSVTLNHNEKILIQCTADIPRKFWHKGHKNGHGYEFDVTKFMMDYYEKEYITWSNSIVLGIFDIFCTRNGYRRKNYRNRSDCL